MGRQQAKLSRFTRSTFAGRLSATQAIHLTKSIAYLAADLRLRHGLAMADAIAYATAKDQEAEVVRATQV